MDGAGASQEMARPCAPLILHYNKQKKIDIRICLISLLLLVMLIASSSE